MPKYVYKCTECKEIIEKIHSMDEKLTDCQLCMTVGSLKRVPSAIAVQYKENNVGKIVDDHIKEAREDLESEKQKILKEEYK
jgi:putative FmdB family regulatory protein